ncbi:MAG: PH domain-containing protein [archaeon YNP-WB-062]|nr:PH domain-containing protein [Candidatus Culexarchaeum yellowstonense]
MTVKLREGEELILKLKPHPIAFMELYFTGLYVAIASILARIYADELAVKVSKLLGLNIVPMGYMSTLVWAVAIMIPFIVMFIAKSSIKWLAAGLIMVIASVAIKFETGITESTSSLFMGVIWLALSNMYKNAHTYYITTDRIIAEYKFIREKTREISYQYITDLVVEKGVIGRILNVGTIIPVSTAGLGLGGEIAAISGKIDVKQTGLGVIAGTNVVMPKGRSPNVLFGVKDPMKIKEIISNEMAKHSESGILTKISENLEKILEKTEKNEGSTTGTVGDEPKGE